VSRVVAVIGQSMPAFWLGILLILLLSVRLGLFPTGGTGTWRHLVLPAIALSVYSIPLTMRLVRSSMLEVLGEEYIKSARAKGLHERAVIVSHALRNALIPVITVLALRVGHVLSGAVVLEEVFAYPGMGRLAIQSMIQLDYDVIQAFAFVVAALIIGANLIADILYGLVDPRIRVR
jgi:peptide/nickel transport system permease protein